MIQINPNPSRVPQPGLEATRDTKGFYELQPGEHFKALVIDIQPGRVTIRLSDGGTFTARATTPPEARIGEESIFNVRDNNFKGQIQLEMLKPDHEIAQGHLLREAFRNAGMQANDDNIALGRALLAEGLPIDAATLQKAAFFRYAHPDATPAQAIFMIKENMPTDVSNVLSLQQTLTQPNALRSALDSLIEDILETPNPDDRRALVEAVFSGDRRDETGTAQLFEKPSAFVRNALRRRLFHALRMEPNANTTTQQATRSRSPLHRFYDDLLESVNNTARTIAARTIQSPVAERITTVQESLRFMEQITQRREYYQIPFTVNPDTQTRQAELFIFKDREAKRDPSSEKTALISLETLTLGHTEVYIQKTGTQSRLTFRCDTDEALRTIGAQMHRLTLALQEKNITVAGVSYKKIDEPFTLLSVEPGAEADTSKKDLAPKRFMFDVRV